MEKPLVILPYPHGGQPVDYGAIFVGDWRTLPTHCGGNVELMDMTVGCQECGQNLWYVPSKEVANGTTGRAAVLKPGRHVEWSAADLLPYWAPTWMRREIEAWEATHQAGGTGYEAFTVLFDMVHPFTFDDCHDDGDSEPWFGPWAGHELHVEAVANGSKLWPREFWGGEPQ